MKALAKKAKNGDANAFARLIQDNENTLYRVAGSYLHNDADIADAVQDTILSCWENIGKLREPKYFRTWMIRILINHCYRILKKQSKEIPYEILPESTFTVSDQGNLEFKEMMACLSENNRIVLTLFYGEDFSVKEIARLLAISEDAVKQRLRRGRTEVKEKYLKAGPDRNGPSGSHTVVKSNMTKNDRSTVQTETHSAQAKPNNDILKLSKMSHTRKVTL